MSRSISLPLIAFAVCVVSGAVALGGTALPQEYPPEERAVMVQFQQALRDRHWGEALSLCSDRVRAAAANYVSPEVFFKWVVPVPQIVEIKSFPTCTIQTKGSGLPIPPEQFVMLGHFVQIPQPEPEPEVSWTWKVYKLDNRWIIDFEPKALYEFIEQETARLKKESEDVRRSQAVADHVITRVKTRLTGLSSDYVVGQPMLFRLELVNGCDFDLVYEAASVEFNSSMHVTDANGQPMRYTFGPVQTCVNYKRIKAGETVVLLDDIDLGKHYDLSKPGRYKVQFSGGGLIVGIPQPRRPEQNYESPIHITSKPLVSNVVEIAVGAAPAK